MYLRKIRLKSHLILFYKENLYIYKEQYEKYKVLYDKNLVNILKENTAVYAYDVNIPYIINKNTIEYRIIIDGLKSIQFSFIKDKGFKVKRVGG